ncbi:MAG: PadR family transcriptional regulator [Firmicutes bacterium]|nr:PadR family transcriptional regulator [Bacillota bacterium]
MVPLYILGILQRFGPQHGYQIKKIIAEQLADFTQIKLPTIYYHLEKLKAEGLLVATNEKPGNRPEKTIYSITDEGIKAFKNMLAGLLEFEYRPTFPSDAVFYFSEHLETADLLSHLTVYIEKLKKVIAVIKKHKQETLSFVPPEYKTIVIIIFSHHEHHYQAELAWAEETLNSLK